VLKGNTKNDVSSVSLILLEVSLTKILTLYVPLIGVWLNKAKVKLLVLRKKSSTVTLMRPKPDS